MSELEITMRPIEYVDVQHLPDKVVFARDGDTWLCNASVNGNDGRVCWRIEQSPDLTSVLDEIHAAIAKKLE